MVKRRAVRAKLSQLSARAKKLLLMRIYLYAIATGNQKLLRMFGAVKTRKGRKSRRKKRRMSAKQRRAMLRNLAKARRARKRR